MELGPLYEVVATMSEDGLTVEAPFIVIPNFHAFAIAIRWLHWEPEPW